MTKSAIAALAAAVACTFVATPAAEAAAAAPSASCTSGLTRLDRRIGDGIPLPGGYRNPTSSTVRFTLRMTANRFFGPAHDITTVTLPPHVGRTSGAVKLTGLSTPLGVGNVTIEVRTDRTGGTIVGRCDYQLHLAAPPPTRISDPFGGLTVRWLTQVPLKMCAVEGSELAAGTPAGRLTRPAALLQTLDAVNATVWFPQAQVAFSTSTEAAIPVIADPTPPSGANGQLGDVGVGFLEIDARLAADNCERAWRTAFPGKPGIPVVNARRFLNGGGTLGVSPAPDLALQVASRRPGSGRRGDDLCGSPVRLTASDVDGGFVVMPDQSRLGNDKVGVLAHELGHNLLLGHGNGLDDNHDGRPAGRPGPRRYDEFCDPGWLAPPANTQVAEDQGSPTPCSLMRVFVCGLELRPLQVETARGVARFVPGSVDGTEVPLPTP